MAGLTALGVGVLVWGGVAASADSPQRSGSPYACHMAACTDAAIYSAAAPLWLPWLVLLALSAVAWLVTLLHGRGHGWMLAAAILSTAAVIFTFPVWIIAIIAMDCGM